MLIKEVISNYYIDDSINMIGYVESIKGSIREITIILSNTKMSTHKSKYISVTKVLDPNSVTETRLINEGDLSTIHLMLPIQWFLEDSIFLNLVNVKESIKIMEQHTR